MSQSHYPTGEREEATLEHPVAAGHVRPRAPVIAAVRAMRRQPRHADLRAFRVDQEAPDDTRKHDCARTSRPVCGRELASGFRFPSACATMALGVSGPRWSGPQVAKTSPLDPVADIHTLPLRLKSRCCSWPRPTCAEPKLEPRPQPRARAPGGGLASPRRGQREAGRTVTRSRWCSTRRTTR